MPLFAGWVPTLPVNGSVKTDCIRSDLIARDPCRTPAVPKNKEVKTKRASPDAFPGEPHEATLKKMRVFSHAVRVEKEKKNQEKRDQTDHSNLFVFCEKATGVAQFRAGCVGSSDYTLDRVAGLFAMQCLVRGYDPNDFLVLVPAEKKVVGKLVARAKDLLEEGRAVAGPASLSPRQKEILHSVVCNRANKEIASKLNITVRTVKFHISSLLNKFGVSNRTDLARRAAPLLRPGALDADPLLSQSAVIANLRGPDVHPDLGPQPVRADFGVERKSPSVHFPGRVATA